MTDMMCRLVVRSRYSWQLLVAMLHGACMITVTQQTHTACWQKTLASEKQMTAMKLKV